MVTLKIMIKSLGRRKGSTFISTLALALSVTLLLIISHLHDAVTHYARNVSSEADLIIGAPADPVHLMLNSLFRIGSPPPKIPDSVLDFVTSHPEVAQAIPVSLRESHRGHPVIGTDNHYLNTLQLSTQQQDLKQLTFDSPTSVWIGARIAKERNYLPGDQMTIADGFSPSLKDEYQTPFTIQGILNPTGTPIDDDILAPLSGLKKARGEHGVSTSGINFIVVKLHSRQALLALQNVLKQQSPAPVEVAIPSAELDKLNHYKNMINNVMLAMAFIIGMLSLLMVFFNLSANFAERKREMELFRMVGARPYQIANMTFIEPLIQIIIALAAGILMYKFGQGLISQSLPFMTMDSLHLAHYGWLLLIFTIGFILAGVPAWKVYGLSKRL
ncbi:hypothetical protein ACH42_07300 [Endozoicomonas sp. (ex Bugula neritina AB1)]|nr:hypothetical protein ACH42_07300 [Endozoicomonas sp. (ex Bugula neritina AB1)]